MTREVALFGDMKKQDWVFLALCLIGAIMCAIEGVKLAIDYRAIATSIQQLASAGK
jgi:hypothetical protein